MRLSISTTRGASDVSEKPLYTSEEVVWMNEKKQFVEPEVVKCEESLDKVTLSYNSYGDNAHRDDRDPWEWLWRLLKRF
jgi:hypothetical protein